MVVLVVEGLGKLYLVGDVDLTKQLVGGCCGCFHFFAEEIVVAVAAVVVVVLVVDVVDAAN